MRETSNPVFRSLPKQQGGYAQFGSGVAGAQQVAYQTEAYGYPPQTGVSRPMTIDDVVTKTGITLALLSAVAVVSYFLVSANIALAMHLAHACTSMFQTLGLSYGKYRPFVVLIGPAIGALLLVGNVLMPLAMMTGMVQVDTIGAVAPVSHGGH